MRSAIASRPSTWPTPRSARGYKAGGFNPAALPGSEAYGEEHAWHVEAGLKSTLAGGKVSANAAMFFINWDDLQLNVPNPFVPGQFYISNVGGARSRGVEFDVTARPRSAIDLFAAFGFTSARFADGTMAGGVDVGDNEMPYTPDYTATLGGQMTRAITSAISGYGRAEIVLTGAFNYDEGNTESQDAYSLVNIRAGARHKRLFGEALVAQRVRHALRADRDSVSRLCAVGIHRREWPAAHVRSQHRSDVSDTDQELDDNSSARQNLDLRSPSSRARWCRARRSITAIADRARRLVSQRGDQLAAGRAVPGRRRRRRRALSRRVRLYVVVARVHFGSPRRGPARADADARDHLRRVLSTARRRQRVRPDRCAARYRRSASASRPARSSSAWACNSAADARPARCSASAAAARGC